MVAAIVRKAFNNRDNNITTSFFNYIPTLDKFALKVFNQLSHNREISRPLVTSYLVNLPDHYFSKAIMKTINTALFQAKFSLILNNKNFNQSDNIVCVNDTKIWSCSMYNYYAHRGFIFDTISIYKYLQFVSIVK